MNAVRPSVFIGSSSEGLEIAKALQVLLDRSAECELWSQGMFGPGAGTLESLLSAVTRFDFALLVVDSDDTAVSRGITKSVPRDNLIFELGLFMGGLGRDRTFMVYDRTRPPDLPSDLLGVTAVTYEPHGSGNTYAALGAASTTIEREIKHLSLKGSVGSEDMAAAAVAEESSFPRVCELLEIHQRYSLSSVSDEHLDMEYYRHQIIQCNAAGGIAQIPMTWTKSSDKLPPFSSTHPAAISLVAAPDRSGPGKAMLGAPRKQAGASFVLDLKLDPPLRMNETVKFSVAGRFPQYKLAKAAAMREATQDSPIGERTFDFFSWIVSYPTRAIKFTVDLPADTGIKPLGPRSSFHNDDFPLTFRPSSALNEEYSETTLVENNNLRIIRMNLRVNEPKFRCRYRLAWQLP